MNGFIRAPDRLASTADVSPQKPLSLQTLTALHKLSTNTEKRTARKYASLRQIESVPSQFKHWGSRIKKRRIIGIVRHEFSPTIEKQINLGVIDIPLAVLTFVMEELRLCGIDVPIA